MSETISSKVVEMSFDNRNFEANVTTSLESISKLKQALNLEKAAKGFEEIDKAASNLQLSKIEEGVTSLSKRFSTMGIVGMTVIEQLTKSGIKLLSNLINNPVINKIKTGGIARAMSIEKARFQLQGMMSDGKKVEEIMQNALDSVTDTAYRYEEAANAASQFAASGVQAGEEMTRALKAIAGVAATTSSDYEGVARIFTTVAGNGRLMGDQLLQLSSRGLNAPAKLAEYFNAVADGSQKATANVEASIKTLTKGAKVTEEDIRKMVSKGLISFDIFSEAMAESFGKHAKDANQTVQGVAANIGAALSRTGALFVTPLVEQNGELVKMLEAIRVKINAINKLVTPFAIAATENIKKLFTAVESFVTNLDLTPISKGIGLFTSLLDGQKRISEEDFRALNLTKKELKVFKNVLMDVAKEHGIDVKAMIKDEGSFYASLKRNWLTGDIFNEALEKVFKKEKKVTEQVQDMAKVRKAAMEVIQGKYGNGPERIDALKKAGFDPKVVQDYVNKIHELTGGTWKYNNAMLDTIDKQIASTDAYKKYIKSKESSKKYTKEEIEVMTNLANAAKTTGTNLNKLSEDINAPKNNLIMLRGAFENVWYSVSKIFGAIRSAFASVFPPSSVSLVTKVASALYKFSEKLRISDETAKRIERTFKGLFSGIDLIRKVFVDLAKTVFPWFFDAALKVASGVVGILARLGDLLVFINNLNKKTNLISDLLRVFPLLFGLIAETAGIAVKAIGDLFANAVVTNSIKEIVNFLSNLVRGIRMVVSTVAEYFGKAFKSSDKLKSSLADLFEIFKSLISVGIEKFLSLFNASEIQNASDLFSKVAETIGTKLGQAVELGTDKLSKFVEFLKNLSIEDIKFNIVTDFKNFFEYLESGEILKAVKSAFEKVIKYIAGYKDRLKSEVTGSFSDIFSYGDDIKGAFEYIKKKLERIDFGRVTAVIVGFITFLTSTKLLSLLTAFTGVVKNTAGLIKSVKGFVVNASGILESVIGLFTTIGEGIKALYEAKIEQWKAESRVKTIYAIIALMGAVVVLAGVAVGLGYLYKHDKEVIEKGIFAIGAMLAIVAAFTIGVSRLAGNNFEPASKGLLMFAGAIAILVLILKAMEKMDYNAVLRNLIPLGVLIVGLLATMGVMKSFKFENSSLKAVGSLILFAIALKVLVWALSDLSKLHLEHPVKMAAALITLGLAMVVLSAIASDIKPSGTFALVGMGVALWLLIKTLGGLKKMSMDDLFDSLVKLTMIIAVVALLLLSTRAAGQYAKGAGVAILGISISLLILIQVIKSLGKLAQEDPERLKQGLIALAKIMVLIGILIAASYLAGQHAWSAGVMFAALGAAFLALAFAMKIMETIEPEKLKNITNCIVQIMLVFAILIAATKLAQSAIRSIIMLTVAMTLMALMLVAFTYVDADALWNASKSLSLAMAMFALMLFATSKIKDVSAKSLVALGLAIAAVALIGGLLYYLSTIGDPDAMLTIAEGLALVLAAMTAALWVVAKSGIGPKQAALAGAAVDAFIVVVGSLVAGLGALDEFLLGGNLGKSLDNGVVLFGKIGEAIGAFLRGVFGEGSQNKTLDKDASEAKSITETIKDTLESVKPLFEAIKEFDDKEALTSLKEFSGVMKDLSVTGLAGGWNGGMKTNAENFAASAPILAEALHSYLTNIRGMSIDEDKLQQSVDALNKIAGIKVGRSSGIISLFTGSESANMQYFGQTMQYLAIGLGLYINNLKGVGINLGSINASCEALQRISDIKIERSSGLISWIAGSEANNMQYFGMTVGYLATGLKHFIDNLKGVGINLGSINTACLALQTISDVDVGRSSGLVGLLIGNKDANMAFFGDGVKWLAKGLSNFIDNLPDGGIPLATIQTACDCLNMISGIDVGKSDGLVRLFTGSTSGDMSKFGNHLGDLAKGLTSFITNLELPQYSTMKVEYAAKLITQVSEMANSNIITESKLGDFCASLSRLGTSIGDFNANLGFVNLDKIRAVGEFLTSLGNATADIKDFDSEVVDRIKEALNKMTDLDFEGIVSKLQNGKIMLEDAVEDLVYAMKNSLSDAPDMSSEVGTMIQKLATQILSRGDIFELVGKKLASKLKNGVSSGLGSEVSDTSEGMTSMMSDSMSQITSQYKEFNKAGGALMTELAAGIRAGSTLVVAACKAPMAGSITGIRGFYSGFYNAGSYLVQGFAKGIDSRQWEAKAKARAMANAAKKAAEDALDENSPSKVFYQIGDYAVQGFANALGDGTRTSYDASYAMANGAKMGLAKAIDRVTAMIDENLDMNPTIRPVIDLSDVQAGANSLNSMFNLDPAVGLSSNLGAISSYMMLKPSSATNDDVVTAINALRKELGPQGDNIVINGITYDDGSNINDAVKALIRAAKVERRA